MGGSDSTPAPTMPSCVEPYEKCQLWLEGGSDCCGAGDTYECQASGGDTNTCIPIPEDRYPHPDFVPQVSYGSTGGGVIDVPLNWFYVLATLLVVLLVINVAYCVVCAMRAKSPRSKSYKAVRVYDSEDQCARVPIQRDPDPL